MCDIKTCGTASDPADRPALSAIDRRRFLAGVAALPLATVLAWPDLARAAADRLTSIEIPTPSGGIAKGVLALPATTPAPAVVLIPEWWGLNDQIKAVAAEFAALGYVAVAFDVPDGEVATTREEATALVQAVDAAATTEKLVSAVAFLRAHEKTTGKVGTIGWCFGGGWSLNTSIATPVDATVIYYGSVAKPAEALAALHGPVLGHFATEDARINRAMVDGFEQAMAAAGKTDLTVHWYEADHAFANPTGARYDADDAALAWQRTVAFFQEHLS